MIKVDFKGNNFHVSWSVEAQLTKEPNSTWFPVALGMYSDMEILFNALNARENDEYTYRMTKV